MDCQTTAEQQFLAGFRCGTEAGIAGMLQDAWYGVLAASSVPGTHRTALSVRLARLLRDPTLQRRLGQDGAEPLGLTGQDAIDYLARQRDVWRATITTVSFPTAFSHAFAIGLPSVDASIVAPFLTRPMASSSCAESSS